MIARVSEKPFWGPEEQIRKFINQHDSTDDMLDASLLLLGYEGDLTALTIPQKEAKIK